MEDKDAVIASLRRRVAELEQENQRLIEQLARSREMSLLRPPSAARLRSELSSSGGAGIASAAAISRERSNSLEAGSAVLAEEARQSNAENVCDNCGREVSAASLSMHRLHCVRNIRKCGACGKALPIREYDEHAASARGSNAALLAAARRGDAASVAAIADMLKHGASPTAPLDAASGDGALHAAARARQLGVLEALLGAGASVNAPNASGDTALHIICALREDGGTGSGGSAASGSAGGSSRRASSSGIPALAPSGGSSGSIGSVHAPAAAAERPLSPCDRPPVWSASPSTGPAAAALAAIAGKGVGGSAAPAGATATAATAVSASASDAASVGSAGSEAAALPPAPAATAADVVQLLLLRGADIEAATPLGDTPLQVAQRSGNLDLAVLLSSSGSSLRPSSRDARRRPASARSLQSLSLGPAPAPTSGSPMLPASTLSASASASAYGSGFGGLPSGTS